jgi:hypothetical protein
MSPCLNGCAAFCGDFIEALRESEGIDVDDEGEQFVCDRMTYPPLLHVPLLIPPLRQNTDDFSGSNQSSYASFIPCSHESEFVDDRELATRRVARGKVGQMR